MGGEGPEDERQWEGNLAFRKTTWLPEGGDMTCIRCISHTYSRQALSKADGVGGVCQPPWEWASRHRSQHGRGDWLLSTPHFKLWEHQAWETQPPVRCTWGRFSMFQGIRIKLAHTGTA